MISEHIRSAYEATDFGLNRLRGLLTALDHLNDATPREDAASPESDAIMFLIEEARLAMVEVERLRQSEWAALHKKQRYA